MKETEKILEIRVEIGTVLASKQTEYVYKKVQLGSLINKDAIKDEIDSDVELDKMDNNSGHEKSYRELSQ